MMHEVIPHFDIVLVFTGFVVGIYAMCIVWAIWGKEE